MRHHLEAQRVSSVQRVQPTQRSIIAIMPRMMQAPAMAPEEDGCKALKKRLSPPLKCSHGIIMAMSMFIGVSLGAVAEVVGIGIDIDMSTVTSELELCKLFCKVAGKRLAYKTVDCVHSAWSK